jgi:hypothetical protein
MILADIATAGSFLGKRLRSAARSANTYAVVE